MNYSRYSITMPAHTEINFASEKSNDNGNKTIQNKH